MTLTASFQGTDLDIIEMNSVRYLRGPQIAGALGFVNPKHISTLFKRAKSEFTPDMTTVVELPTAGGMQLVRIYSPRGAALLAMLAKTERAAAFRSWVLDVLDARYQASALPAPAVPEHPLESLLDERAKRILRYRRMGLSSSEAALLVGCGRTTVNATSAKLRAAGLLGVHHG